MKIQSNISVCSDVEAYGASTLNCFAFRHGYDVRQDLSSSLGYMVRGFPFEFNRHNFMFSGYACKRFGKARFHRQVTEDFPTFRLQWMLFSVWQKCKGNAEFINE